MISVQRLDGSTLVVNAAHIITMATIPETLLTLSTGEQLLVRDSPLEITDRVICYLQRLGLTATAATVRKED